MLIFTKYLYNKTNFSNKNRKKSAKDKKKTTEYFRIGFYLTNFSFSFRLLKIEIFHQNRFFNFEDS